MLLARSELRYNAVRFDAWSAFAVCLVPFATLLVDGQSAMRRTVALLCLSALCAYTLHTVRRGDADPSPTEAQGGREKTLGPATLGKRRDLAFELAGGILGVALLTAGSNDLVEQLVSGSVSRGASDAAGATLAAAATSLPELFVALYAALRGWTAIAVGSVLGSNVFNMLGALGGVLLLAPLPATVGHPVLDAVVMTVACGCAIVLLRARPHRARWLAVPLLLGWIAYAAITVLEMGT